MAEYTLLTGATGLVGNFLMRNLLARSERVAILVRRDTQSRRRVQQFLKWCEAVERRPLLRPVILEGDVNRPQLGLASFECRWVARNCRRVVHSAASLSFFNLNREQDPWRTNVEGTRKLLNFCRQAKLRELHYVSTAYVCGRRCGPIREDELDAGQVFRNDYEHSKFLAETHVRQCDWIDPVTVYRPVVVTGDSRTGYTPNFHGMHFYLKLLDRLLSTVPANPSGRKHAPLRVPLTGDEPQLLVPVDWIGEVMGLLLETPAARGLTFHLAPQAPLTSGEFLKTTFQLLNCSGLQFVGAASTDASGSRAPNSQLERAFLGQTNLYREYERSGPIFDDTNVRRFAAHLPCPRIDAPLLARYLQFGQSTSWGRHSLLDESGTRRQAA